MKNPGQSVISAYISNNSSLTRASNLASAWLHVGCELPVDMTGRGVYSSYTNVTGDHAENTGSDDNIENLDKTNLVP